MDVMSDPHFAHRLGLIVIVAATALASCSSDSRPRETVPRRPDSCAWRTRADRATQNVAYPDTGATYWGTRFRLARGEHLAVTGAFPLARYFSFITYDTEGDPQSVLTDRKINATSGGNRYAGGVAPATAGRYSVRVLPVASSTPDTVGANSEGSLVYRVYLPTDRSSRTGGVPLPSIRVVGPGGADRSLPTCRHPGANPRTVRIVTERGPVTNRPVPDQPTFIRPETVANLFPNPDNVYLATLARYTPGHLLVIRGRAPSFPDTRTGMPVIGTEQVRYWSVCTNEYRKPYPVTACAADDEIPVSVDGTFTIVVSSRSERPANATAANDVAWLDWGNTRVDLVVLVRHMLPSATFSESALDVAPGALASTAMGPFAPQGVTCPVETFMREGPEGCPE